MMLWVGDLGCGQLRSSCDLGWVFLSIVISQESARQLSFWGFAACSETPYRLSSTMTVELFHMSMSGCLENE